MTRAALASVAIVAPAAQFMRCPCPTCRRLDRAHPGEGYQLALFAYRIQGLPKSGLKA